MNTYSVYHLHTSPDLNGGYIGVSKDTNFRYKHHISRKKKSNPILDNAFRVYGDLMKVRVLVKNLELEAALLLEEMLRPTSNIGWNQQPGGNIPPDPTGKSRSTEYRQNISKSKMGEKNPAWGTHPVFSKIHKQKIAEAAKNAPFIQCPHCQTVGRGNGMKRWHFDRCKDADIN